MPIVCSHICYDIVGLGHIRIRVHPSAIVYPVQFAHSCESPVSSPVSPVSTLQSPDSSPGRTEASSVLCTVACQINQCVNTFFCAVSFLWFSMIFRLLSGRRALCVAAPLFCPLTTPTTALPSYSFWPVLGGMFTHLVKSRLDVASPALSRTWSLFANGLGFLAQELWPLRSLLPPVPTTHYHCHCTVFLATAACCMMMKPLEQCEAFALAAKLLQLYQYQWQNVSSLPPYPFPLSRFPSFTLLPQSPCHTLHIGFCCSPAAACEIWIGCILVKIYGSLVKF